MEVVKSQVVLGQDLFQRMKNQMDMQQDIAEDDDDELTGMLVVSARAAHCPWCNHEIERETVVWMITKDLCDSIYYDSVGPQNVW
jgi:hypothetical protein